MRRLFPLNSGRTLILDLFTAPTPEEIIAEARAAHADGADGLALELHGVRREFLTPEVFREVFASVPLPFMVAAYRRDSFGDLKDDDEGRYALLRQAAEAGAGMIDLIGDQFAPAPDECTHDPAAIARQKECIAELHSMGAKVIMSSHPLRPMKTAEVLRQLREFADRGADVVKLVETADTPEEFAESIRTTCALQRELDRPFVHLCGGRFASLQRPLGLKLGVAITFGVHEYYPDRPYNQPLVRSLLEIQRIFPAPL